MRLAPATLVFRNESDNFVENDWTDDSDASEDGDNDDGEADQQCAECGAAGDVDMFETNVLQIVGYDFALAASLIPILHIMAHQDHMSAITRGAGEADRKNAGTSAEGGQSSSSGGSGRKRSADKSGQDQDTRNHNDEDEEDGNKDHDLKRTRRQKSPRLACPFHKWMPEKYNMYYEADQSGTPKFRTCHGPGFDNISRLK